MPLPLHELAYSDQPNTIVRLTENGLEFFERAPLPVVEDKTSLIPIAPSKLASSTASTST